MIESPKNFIEQFQNFIEHIAGVMKTFLTKEAADNYYLGKTAKAVSAGTADTAGSATKATQDANGNVIPETYATKSELTSGLATKQPVGDYPTKSELDSAYLGINDKAKSAEIADKAVILSDVLVSELVHDGNAIKLRISESNYTCPKNGLLITSGSIAAGTYYLNGAAVRDPFLVQKGDLIRHTNWAESTIHPFTIKSIS